MKTTTNLRFYSHLAIFTILLVRTNFYYENRFPYAKALWKYKRFQKGQKEEYTNKKLNLTKTNDDNTFTFP